LAYRQKLFQNLLYLRLLAGLGGAHDAGERAWI
jgi:hypothetical protein